MQLGGPKVMAVNGVSHHVVEDDLAGCAAVLQWLAFVPAVLGSQPPTLASSDHIERPISYAPSQGVELRRSSLALPWSDTVVPHAHTRCSREQGCRYPVDGALNFQSLVGLLFWEPWCIWANLRAA